VKMLNKPNISLPNLGFKVKLLALRDKDLPLTPTSGRIVALEYEKKKLWTENQVFRNQFDVWANQLRRFHKAIDSCKTFAKETALSVRHLQDAHFTMRHTEREAEKEWANFKATMQNHMADDTESGENQL
jgi:hypothetical protein